MWIPQKKYKNSLQYYFSPLYQTHHKIVTEQFGFMPGMAKTEANLSSTEIDKKVPKRVDCFKWFELGTCAKKSLELSVWREIAWFLALLKRIEEDQKVQWKKLLKEIS